MISAYEINGIDEAFDSQIFQDCKRLAVDASGPS